MNITLSKCGLNVIHKLTQVLAYVLEDKQDSIKSRKCFVECFCRNFVFKPQAFSEGAVSKFDHSLKEKAPFTIRNFLGIPLIIQHGANLRIADSPPKSKMHELGVGESLDLEFSVFEFSTRAKLSTLQRQESCLFNLSIGIIPSSGSYSIYFLR